MLNITNSLGFKGIFKTSSEGREEAASVRDALNNTLKNTTPFDESEYQSK